MPPFKCAFLVPKPGTFLSLYPPSRLFVYRILYPIDGRKIFVALDLADLFRDYWILAIGGVRALL
jgi:hypothetical protein